MTKRTISPLLATLLCSAALSTAAYGQTGKRIEFLKDQTGCRSDIAQFCSSMKAGGGRLYNCLDKNKAGLTESCIKVMPEEREVKLKPMTLRVGAHKSDLTV
jgi:hypothetical protein